MLVDMKDADGKVMSDFICRSSGLSHQNALEILLCLGLFGHVLSLEEGYDTCCSPNPMQVPYSQKGNSG